MFRLEADWVYPPGETLQEALEDIGMSQVEFATQIGLELDQLNQIIQGSAELTPDIVNRLESTLGIPARVWNNLEDNYRNHRKEP